MGSNCRVRLESCRQTANAQDRPERWETRVVYVRDPDGTTIEFMEAVGKGEERIK